MRKVKIKEALNPYEDMDTRNKLNTNMSTRDLGQRDSLYETEDNRGKSAQNFRHESIEAQIERQFKYGGPTSRSNTKSHFKTQKQSTQRTISVINETRLKSEKSYNSHNKINHHLSKKICDKDLLIDMPYVK